MMLPDCPVYRRSQRRELPRAFAARLVPRPYLNTLTASWPTHKRIKIRHNIRVGGLAGYFAVFAVPPVRAGMSSIMPILRNAQKRPTQAFSIGCSFRLPR